ncbi:MAG: XisI protein [Spirulina sp. SIO3F2]|nr:XisI protein [Spirulina sp. SIO3F2]
MDKIQKYQHIIREILHDQAHPYGHSDDVDTLVICDTEHDHYQLSYIGWEGQQRIFNLILHFDIKDGKIWIQHNGTETAIAQVLVEKGVEQSDIVIGFHSPFKRQFNGYAVA